MSVSVTWIGEPIVPGGYWKQPASTRLTLLATVAVFALAYLVYEQARRST